MAIQRLTIEEFLLRSKDHLLLDVRSPAEYAQAHVPGAQSLPLFSDEERSVVGTAYKQQSREQAIKVGLDYFGPKMRPMVEQVERWLLQMRDHTGKADKHVFVYCWRGGMRSAGVAWLLDLYGFKVCTLSGGYKAFRNHVLRTFEFPFNFKILGGYTGSGKTELLQELARHKEAVIDLEQLASHKGSAFGSFNMPLQPRQEMFENLLAMQLSALKEAQYIWLEDESQRIGSVNIPGAMWSTMRKAPVYFLDIPFEERLNHITATYGLCEIEHLMDCTRRISKRLGGLETRNALQFLEERNIQEAFRILLRYYDKFYHKSLHRREDLSGLLTIFKCPTVDAANALPLVPIPII